jgi:hypothetical protein
MAQGLENAERRELLQDEILCDIKALSSNVNEFKQEMAKYRGYFGGVVFVVSSMGIFLSWFKDPILHFVRSKFGG